MDLFCYICNLLYPYNEFVILTIANSPWFGAWIYLEYTFMSPSRNSNSSEAIWSLICIHTDSICNIVIKTNPHTQIQKKNLKNQKNTMAIKLQLWRLHCWWISVSGGLFRFSITDLSGHLELQWYPCENTPTFSKRLD